MSHFETHDLQTRVYIMVIWVLKFPRKGTKLNILSYIGALGTKKSRPFGMGKDREVDFFSCPITFQNILFWKLDNSYFHSVHVNIISFWIHLQ